MTNEERDIQLKLRVFQYDEKIGNSRKACRYFLVGRRVISRRFKRAMPTSVDCPSSNKMGHQSGLSFGVSGSFV
jgi:hypothetical protein